MASIIRSARASSSASAARSARPCSLRFASTETAGPEPSPESAAPVSPPKPITVQHLLQRRPYLTPTPPRLLAAIEDYNHRLSLALSTPTPTHICFKKGTLPTRRYTYEQAVLERDVFGTPIGEDVEVIEKEEATGEIRPRDALVKDELDKKTINPGEERKSANREGEKSLYLVVKTPVGWRFPGGDGRKEFESPEHVGRPKFLHETAAYVTHSLLGPNISLWPITRLPIAHIPSDASPTFIFKSHALAGKPVLTELAKSEGITDYAWLTKAEIGELVTGPESGNGCKVWWGVVEPLLNEN